MSTTTSPGETVRPNQSRKAALSAYLGSSLEYYDFYIYGSATALVFGKVFFPEAEHATLLSISTLGVAYVARPFGAFFWGHVGDRFGRKRALMGCLTMMGVATFLVGCLPSYQSIGVFAPVLLVLMRLLQGISAGGESVTSSSMTLEHAPDHRRAFFASFTISGVFTGIVLSTIVLLALSSFPDEAFFSWGWRVAFWPGGFVTVIAYYLRRNLDEPEVFQEIQESDDIVQAPSVTVFRSHWRTVLMIVFAQLFAGIHTVLAVFGLSFAVNNAGIDRSTMLWVIAVASAAAAITSPMFGALSDRIGRKPLFAIGSIGSALGLAVYFWAIAEHNIPLVFVSAVVILAGLFQMPNGSYLVFFAEQFPAPVRVSGTAIGVMIGLLAAGFSPTVAEALTNGTTDWAPVVWMMLGLTVVASIAAMTGRETHRIPTDELGLDVSKRDLEKA